MSEIEAALQRITGYQGVLGLIIVGKDKSVLRSSVSPEISQQYALEMPDLVDLARRSIRDLDPQNDLKFLRIRSKQHEIMVAPFPEFSLIVVQDVQAEE